MLDSAVEGTMKLFPQHSIHLYLKKRISERREWGEGRALSVAQARAATRTLERGPRRFVETTLMETRCRGGYCHARSFCPGGMFLTGGNGEEYQGTEQWEGAGHVNPRLKEKYALRGIPSTSAARFEVVVGQSSTMPSRDVGDDTELSANARGMPPSRSSHLSLNL